MRILFLLIPMALGVIGVAFWAFLWAVRTGSLMIWKGRPTAS